MKRVLTVAAALMINVAAFAQIGDHVKWSCVAKRVSPTKATVFVMATIAPGWHIYSQYIKDGGPIKTSFSFNNSKEYTLVGKTAEPKAIITYNKQFAMNIGYFEKQVIFRQKIKTKSANVSAVKDRVNFMVCNDKNCIPASDVYFTVPVPLKLAGNNKI